MTDTSAQVKSFWTRQDRPSTPKSASTRRAAIVAFFILQLVGVILLQKFAVNLDLTPFRIPLSTGLVQVTLPIFYLGLFALLPFVRVRVDIIRLLLFSVVLLTVTLSIVLQRNTFSASSVLLFVVCYLPFIVVVPISERTYKELLGIFLNAMIVCGVVMLLQHATQLIWSWRVWPNLNLLIPENILFPNFNYNQAIIYGSKLMKPQAIVFLEVSTLSQFTAVALAIELTYFQRIWRIIFYACVLLACFAGTGLFLLVLCAPVLVLRLSPRTILMVLAVFAATYFVADRIHWYQQVQGRFTEYKQQGSSADYRFVAPFHDLVEAFNSPRSMVTGIGPGNTAKTTGYVTWASTKMVVEYGLLTAISFFVFFCYVIFKNAPSQRLSFVMLMLFNFLAGGVIIPMYPVLIFLLSGLFMIDGQGKNGKRKRKGQAVNLGKLFAQLGIGRRKASRKPLRA
jgi:hypothetical protein